jgi:hypothetical protein
MGTDAIQEDVFLKAVRTSVCYEEYCKQSGKEGLYFANRHMFLT